MNTGKTVKLLFSLIPLLLVQVDAKAQDASRIKIKDRFQAAKTKLREKLSTKAQETVTLAERTVTLWRPELSKLHAPLIFFSHGLNGCETQSTFLAQALAEAGFIVVAPRHKDAVCGKNSIEKPEKPFAHPESWTAQTYADRKDDFFKILEALKADPKNSKRIDFDNIGLLGHSLGGYTVLGLAGGWKEWKMKGIRAVVALSPYCQPFAKQQTLKGISAPVQYQGGNRDIGITPFISHKNGCYDQTPSPAMFLEFEGAGHFSWTDLQKKSHNSMIFYTVTFFERHMLGVHEPALKSPREDVLELRTK